MTITVGHAIIALLISAFVLLAVALLAIRNSRTVYPVRCVHCWKRLDRETTVTYSHKPDEWAICKSCVNEYWRIDALSEP